MSYEEGFEPKRNDPQSERIQSNQQGQAVRDAEGRLAQVRGKLGRLADVPLSELPGVLGDLLNEVAQAQWAHDDELGLPRQAYGDDPEVAPAE